MKKYLGILLAAVLLCTCLIPSVAADDYKYTVRFYAGAQGEFSGGETVIEFTDLSYGDRVTFDPDAVTVADNSKYYVKGIRESGKDNNTVGLTSFEVTKDADYVVAYGILGDVTKYTVKYVDSNGKELAKPMEYYGNVGDKPVVAYLYIEGYIPDYYNLTKTLSEDDSENVFTFTYLVNESAAAGTGQEIVIIEQGGGAGAAGGAQGGIRVEPGNNQGNQGGQGDNPTQNIGDLDVPTANPGNNSSTPEISKPDEPSGPNTPGGINKSNRGFLIAGLSMLGIAMLGFLAFLFFRKKKED